MILGRLKKPLAEGLYDKVLHADAEMNRADGLTGLAAIAGVIGIGMGLWWADSVAALVIALDVDHFKVVNDTYGHVSGDVVLVELGRRMLQATRSTDLSARYGGEEFVVMLPETDEAGAAAVEASAA